MANENKDNQVMVSSDTTKNADEVSVDAKQGESIANQDNNHKEDNNQIEYVRLSEAQKKSRKKFAYVTAGLIVLFVISIYLVTIFKLGAEIFVRPL